MPSTAITVTHPVHGQPDAPAAISHLSAHFTGTCSWMVPQALRMPVSHQYDFLSCEHIDVALSLTWKGFCERKGTPSCCLLAAGYAKGGHSREGGIFWIAPLAPLPVRKADGDAACACIACCWLGRQARRCLVHGCFWILNRQSYSSSLCLQHWHVPACSCRR